LCCHLLLEEDVKDQTMLRSTTTRFPHMQGLLLLPIGLWMMLSSSLEAWWPWRNEIIALPAGALAVVAYLSIKRFYSRIYGWVSPSKSQQWWLGLAFVAALAILLGGLEVDTRGLAQFSTSGVSSGILLMAYWRWAIGFRWHHVILGLGVIAVSLLPLVTTLQADELFGVVGFAQGVMLSVGGIFDHSELSHSWGSIRERQRREGWGTTGGSA
jgi:hypothetical protein